MRACIRSLLVATLASLVIIGIGSLGYASYNNGYVSGYECGYSLGYHSGDKGEFARGDSFGYDYGYQAKVEYNRGYNCGYQVGCQEAAAPGDSVGLSSQTIELKNPTFQEVKDFILEDTTSRNKFVLNQYECRHFATEVNNNAEAEGLRCAFVLLCFEKGQHGVVAFDTTDRGLVYIEPQTDAVIHPELGGKYQGKEMKEILTAW